METSVPDLSGTMRLVQPDALGDLMVQAPLGEVNLVNQDPLVVGGRDLRRHWRWPRAPMVTCCRNTGAQRGASRGVIHGNSGARCRADQYDGAASSSRANRHATSITSTPDRRGRRRGAAMAVRRQ
jgi:hypothetical protein